MPTVQEDILNAFTAKLSKSPSVDPATAEALRNLLTSAKKLKADDVIALLAKDPTGGAL
jgi:uncharacterized protein YbjQ (UPF0145 family)